LNSTHSPIAIFFLIFAILVILYLPNDAFALTFTTTTADGLDGTIREINNNNICANTSSLSFFASLVNNLVQADNTGSSTGDCWRAVSEFDISNLPSGSRINSVNFTYEQTLTLNMGATSCDWISLDVQPSTSSASDVWNSISDGGTGTIMLNANTDCRTDETDKLIELGTIGVTELQDHLDNQLTWFGIGVKQNSEVVDATVNRFAIIDSGQSPTPVPTLTVDYDPPVMITPQLFENDGTTIITAGKAFAENSTATWVSGSGLSLGNVLTLNSTGEADFQGHIRNALNNFTFIETTDNFIVNKTLNYNATNSNSTFSVNSLIFRIDCASTGVGDDVIIKTNDTDGHVITSFSTPSCDANDLITWEIDWIGMERSGDTTTYTSSVIAEIINLSIFGTNAKKFNIRRFNTNH